MGLPWWWCADQDEGRRSGIDKKTNIHYFQCGALFLIVPALRIEEEEEGPKFVDSFNFYKILFDKMISPKLIPDLHFQIKHKRKYQAMPTFCSLLRKFVHAFVFLCPKVVFLKYKTSECQ